MCEYCDYDFMNKYFEPHKYNRNNVVLYDHMIHKDSNFPNEEIFNEWLKDENHDRWQGYWSIQTNIRFANKFNKNKRTSIQLECPINYCPWCGKKLE